MMALASIIEISPEQTKTIAIVTVMIASFIAALLYPVVRAYARRMEAGARTGGLQDELSEMAARVEELQQGQARILELEARLDFAERVLIQQRDAGAPESLGRLGTGQEG